MSAAADIAINVVPATNRSATDNFSPALQLGAVLPNSSRSNYADTNLVRLPDEIDFVTASSLGCRFATSFRAVVDQGKVEAGQWVAVHGCGGVGLSAIMIAAAFGARVIAVDIDDEKLEFAKSIGAAVVINSNQCSSDRRNSRHDGRWSTHLASTH